LITPPLLPQEKGRPAIDVLGTKALFTFKDGEIQVPQGPGPGLDINDEALEGYHVA
jgi:L-alanine-DL-glutamate epimerase-like enolase superfamily enzyme